MVFGDQRIDDLAQPIAGQNLVEVVEREVDAVVGDATLREIVSADALGAVSLTDHLLPLCGACLIGSLALNIIKACFQQLHRLCFVFVL